MNANNKNNSSSKVKKVLNPKANVPAVYIPCWLIQVPVKQLSHAAKIVYGRLTQWCNESGIVFRSTPQLSQELGMCVSSVEKSLKELRDAELIGTFHPQAGGVNHFEFYDHPWMHEEINRNLIYKNPKDDPPYGHDAPPYNHTVPPVQSYGTPPYDHTDINNKEIKINNNNTPNGFSAEKLVLLTLENMLADNPHEIDSEVMNEWLVTRKKKKAPITKTTWARTNKVMQRLKEAGLSPQDCFERMVANGWQGMEYKYFEAEIKSKPKFVAKENRKEENKKILEREKLAESRKREEIRASRGIKGIIDQAKSFIGIKDIQEKQELERKKLGMTPIQYHQHLLKETVNRDNDVNFIIDDNILTI